MIIAEKSLFRAKYKERFNVKSFRSVRRFIGFTRFSSSILLYGFENKKEDS
jgi:hypothetical protein